ncbi:MAG: 4a-hydroxytetrahydrobiopterin dehydratase [Armatimonadetes bacterium]|nr:4a-hydroxytetrahydrobiopterin dehydratase [Armatimonadota bacterium]MBS1727409.1 4a-hydroxytetrahydrobiopterin dehydratase [Armatimonadota bacterium]
MERRKLDPHEIETMLPTLGGWSYNGEQIRKTFKFGSYKDGLVFAVAVGQLADRMDHHPDLFIGYQRVEVGLNTHDLGGISTFDFELARQIESLV